MFAVFQPQFLAAVFDLLTGDIDELIERLDVLVLGAEGALLEVALDFQPGLLAAQAGDSRILLDGLLHFGDGIAALHLAGDELVRVPGLTGFSAQPELSGDQFTKLGFL